jgi:homoisocitrate dehydrogenase
MTVVPAARQLCLIPGDGIGPEVTGAAVEVLAAAMPVPPEIVRADAGWQTFCDRGNSVPPETFAQIRQCRAALFGAVSSPSRPVAGYRSAILRIRQELALGANLRPVDGRFGNPPRPEIDLLVVRENTECLYVGRERREGDCAIAERWITAGASTAIGSLAARLALAGGRERITIVHKANVLPQTDGLFRDSARSAIESVMGGRQCTVDEMLVDVAALKLVAEPEQFQVIVTTNLFGDILSDLASHWCNGLGRAPSLNCSTDPDGIAVAEPVHGSAPDIAGKGIADPTAAILSAALLCRHAWNDEATARQLEDAALAAIAEWGNRPMETAAFARLVRECLAA